MLSPSFIFVIVLLAQESVWCYSDDIYQSSDPYDSIYPYQDDYDDNNNNNDIEIQRRANNHYLRFGRSEMKRRDPDFNNDYIEDFARPTRSGHAGEKNDHFIRFGRSRGQDFLRFGRIGSNYLRFGRSVDSQHDNGGKIRSKRDLSSFTDYKRGGSNYLRFGRNNNFLRFGRNNENGITATAPVPNFNDQTELEKLKHFYENTSPLVHFLLELIDNIKKQQQSKCTATTSSAA